MERREALEAAFEKMEQDETPEPEKKEVPVDEGQQTEQLQGQKEELDAKGGEEADKQPDKSETPDKEVKKPDEYTRAGKAADTTTLKAPVSWKPTAKSQWEKLPSEIKNEVLRREKEMSQFVSQNDHHRKFNEAFTTVVKPFEHLIRSQNSTPLAAVRNLMTTAAGLTTGNKQQKASIVAEIIANYGVDVETLDLVLSGKGAQIKPAQDDINPRLMQMLQPVYGFMSEVQQARELHEQRRQQQADELVESFEKPYFDDVREDMADIMEVAAKRGIKMTLDQAYEKAVALNPEVSQLVSKEKEAEQARLAGTRLAKARRTASTITGGPAGVPDGKGAPKTRREQLEAAWDDSTQH